MINKNEAVAVCTECRTVMSDEQAFKDKFLQAGKPAACKACGGVVTVVMYEDLNRVLEQLDRSRGIGREDLD